MKNTNTISYEIKYVTMQNINGQNIGEEVPLCLRFTDVDAYFIEENEKKYLLFALTEHNKEEVFFRLKMSNIHKFTKMSVNMIVTNNSNSTYKRENQTNKH